MKIENAMLLAAGLGTRMRPLTLTTPKPLVKVGGRALIDYALDELEKVNVTRVVINLHHLGGQVRAHCQRQQKHRPFEFIFSDEGQALLESGGGVVKALPLLEERPFFILNSDSFWQEPVGALSNLENLAAHFDADKMDMLLLTLRRDQAALPERGDFLMDESRRLSRSQAGDPQALVYSGALITHPKLFAQQKLESHSLNVYFDRAIATGRLYGLALQGRWYTVGTMAAISAVETLLTQTQ